MTQIANYPDLHKKTHSSLGNGVLNVFPNDVKVGPDK